MIKLIDLLKEVEAQQVEEDWKSKLAGGMMAAASVFGSGDTAKAQSKAPVDTVQQARQGTSVDGIVGQYTSQFKFPPAFLQDLNSGTVKNLGVDGNQALDDAKKLLGSDAVKKMEEWNKFVDWLKKSGYSGNKEMDHVEFSQDKLDQYKKINPDFWIEDRNDIRAVQKAIKDYRTYTIAMWQINKGDIGLGGKDMDENNPEDVKAVQDRYMKWAK